MYILRSSFNIFRIMSYVLKLETSKLFIWDDQIVRKCNYVRV